MQKFLFWMTITGAGLYLLESLGIMDNPLKGILKRDEPAKN